MIRTTRDAMETALAQGVDQLNDDELEVLLQLCTRLVNGKRTYGALSLGRDRRDFMREAEEENLDRAIYEAIDYRIRVRRRHHTGGNA